MKTAVEIKTAKREEEAKVAEFKARLADCSSKNNKERIIENMGYSKGAILALELTPTQTKEETRMLMKAYDKAAYDLHTELKELYDESRRHKLKERLEKVRGYTTATRWIYNHKLDNN